jgi:glycosyltransferase involved in cell wall biosynthesis
MALLEAAACGLPALGTPVGVLPEVGQVAADEGALAGCLDDLLHAGRALQAQGEAARARVEADFGLEVAGERFRLLYQEVANSAYP